MCLYSIPCITTLQLTAVRRASNECVCVRKVLEYHDQFNLLLRSPLARVLVGYQPCVVSSCVWIRSRFTFMQSLLACLHPVNLKFETSSPITFLHSKKIQHLLLKHAHITRLSSATLRENAN